MDIAGMNRARSTATSARPVSSEPLHPSPMFAILVGRLKGNDEAGTLNDELQDGKPFLRREWLKASLQFIVQRSDFIVSQNGILSKSIALARILGRA
jgi:hypothetical protein